MMTRFSSYSAKVMVLSFGTADDEGSAPASTPTILVEIDPELRNPTALPAPPLVPMLSTFEPRLPTSSIPEGCFDRPTIRMAAATKLRLVREMRPSSAPTVPPTAPGARMHTPLRNAA
jgi:hypothetical protein